ncbi:Peptidase M24, structural domain protein [Akanthomyces lecanii RCEF 1005]|uniref:Probable Xaa-Pro aminopeptidase P n=1 Tax=Akanthomyces lecanii RCEF 1005 TaxID=1081108 RepID=A0A162KKR7_CORDF|nr:Peptidase M24, structural domain protein [Akanthomyces lecanii RCEF 1005]
MLQVNTSLRLAQLRELMRRSNITTYIVPPDDSHASEYVADCFRRSAYISGFSGGSGWAAISEEGAALTTDGRYLKQAARQLDSNWTLFDDGWEDWLAEKCKDGKSAAVDPTLMSPAVAEELTEIIQKAGGSGLVAVTDNLVDKIWGNDRPPPPTCSVFIHPDKYAGKGVKAKLAELREVILKNDASGMYITMLDEVAWLFNLRGSDVRYNPVFYSYAFVATDKAVLYVDALKVDESVNKHLAINNASVKPYDSFYGDVGEATEGKYLITNKAPWALRAAIGGDRAVEVGAIADAKSIKNAAELQGMRACHIRDGAALTSYFAWLEHQLIVENTTITEAEAADKLLELRKKQPLFVGNSFETISCTGSNAAITHYHARHGTSSVIDPNAVYFCDSGGQYYDGTTDTTRTFHFATPSDQEKEAYTRVLKGLIALHRAVFPRGVTGHALNVLAKQFLWNVGLNFRHGTGHGVGSFLNVHEGPMGIGSRPAFMKHPLRPGNVLSNEPGCYQDGSFGIRIENIMCVVEVRTKNYSSTPFYGFENVTMVPYCRNLMDLSFLSPEEKDWINARNAETLEKTQDLVANDEVALAWLKRNTEPL